MLHRYGTALGIGLSAALGCPSLTAARRAAPSQRCALGEFGPAPALAITGVVPAGCRGRAGCTGPQEEACS